LAFAQTPGTLTRPWQEWQERLLADSSDELDTIISAHPTCSAYRPAEQSH
jgi:hypothetical protein